MHNAHPVYRPDIDGLRAVAILSVVIFHAFPHQLSGGFVGVDVFFVISGFLISSIIFRSLQRGDFSFLDFYAHRIRRIFPALIVVLLISYLFGWFALLPDELKHLGKHMAAGAGFIQNFILLKEVGYFDTVAELKPLLHLWSLAIEEQFYLIYPLLIIFIWRSGFNVLRVILLLCLVSFGLNVVEVDANPTKAFFLPQTRFWELLVGATLAYFQFFMRTRNSSLVEHWIFDLSVFRDLPKPVRNNEVLNNIFSVVGLLVLMAAFFCVNKSKPFPGWWALLPVLGASFLILAGPDALGNRVILANRLMVFIGVISYPLYLWHWPILSFARIVESEIPSSEARIVALAASFILAWMTYVLIERPIRFGKTNRWSTVVVTLFLAAIGYVGYNAFEHNGLPFRGWIESYQSKSKDLSWDLSKFGYVTCDEKEINPAPSLNFCLFSKSMESPEMVVFGDSHAAHLFHGLAQKDFANWMLIGNSSCPPVSGIHVIGDVKNCDILSARALDYIVNSNTIKTVVLSFFGNYALDSSYAADHLAMKVGPETIKITSQKFKTENKPEMFFLGLEQTVSKLEKAQKSVILVVDIPELPFFPKACIGRPFSEKKDKCAVPRAEVSERQKVARGIVNRLQEAHPKLRIYDPIESFCDQSWCYAEREGVLLYRDSHHLSISGSNRYASDFLSWLKNK